MIRKNICNIQRLIQPQSCALLCLDGVLPLLKAFTFKSPLRDFSMLTFEEDAARQYVILRLAPDPDRATGA